MKNPIHFDLKIISLRRAQDVGRLFLFCLLVGMVSGVGAIVFYYLLETCKHYFLDVLAGYRPGEPLGEGSPFHHTTQPFSRWVLFALPSIGGLISGLLVYFFAPEAEGHGTDAAIDSYHFRAGAIRARVPFIKTIASALTIGTGGSAGREGPIAQIGAGFGSILAGWFNLSSNERRILLAAGMGAGIGAIFRAPLAGALFVAEVFYREMEFEYEVIAPAIISSTVAYSIFSLVFGWSPLFVTPHFSFHNPLELVFYLLLALVIAIGAQWYVQIFYGVRNFFRLLPITNALKPAIGGVIVGTVGLFIPQALATGFGVLQSAFQGESSSGNLWLIAMAKIVTTAFTVGTGGSGGVFGPAVVIGGALGGGVGALLHRYLPHLLPQPGAFAMVGMAGFFAAAANTPISTVIMVSEMTGNYQLLVPSMLVCMTGFLLARQYTIYEKQVPTREDSPVHTHNLFHHTLERIQIADVLSLRPPKLPTCLSSETVLNEIKKSFGEDGLSSLPIVGSDGELIGEINRTKMLQVIAEDDKSSLNTAQDLAAPPVTILGSQSLDTALHLMLAHQRKELWVIESAESTKVVDMLTSFDVINFCAQQENFMVQPPFEHSIFRKWFKEVSHHHSQAS